jgi:hypothetical protein
MLEHYTQASDKARLEALESIYAVDSVVRFVNFDVFQSSIALTQV